MHRPPPGDVPPQDGPAAADELDWFGHPIRRAPRPVACPRCDRFFDDGAELRAHLVRDHDVRLAGRRRRHRSTGTSGRPALGRDPLSPTAARLRTVPLSLVVAANLAVGLLGIAALDHLDPAWWGAISENDLARLAFVPMMWPTVAFLMLRGVD